MVSNPTLFFEKEFVIKKILHTDGTDSTEEFVARAIKPAGKKMVSPKIILPLVVVFLVGVSTRFVWPKTIQVQKEVSVPKLTEKVVFRQAEVDPEELNLRAYQLLLASLEDSRFGVLVVRDNEAQTVLKKRAALGSKQGFVDLRNDIFYPIHNWCLQKDIGYGIASDGQRNFFMVVWLPGLQKAPLQNPKSFRILSGIKLEFYH